MSSWFFPIAVAVAGLGVGALAFRVTGPERLWALAGPPDLGPAGFETLKRRRSPNDALACPAGFCTAKSDITPPVFTMPATALRRAFANAIAPEPDIEKVASDDASLTDRFVQRTKLMRFPDTIDVRFIDLAGERSTLALYSRSQIGRSDFGVNRARIERWLSRLVAEASGTSQG
jgi:uncharacterized protein (DUF1499 family)